MSVHPESSLKRIGILLADADARQGFMDILANDVIKPLEILKVSQDDFVLASLF